MGVGRRPAAAGYLPFDPASPDPIPKSAPRRTFRPPHSGSTPAPTPPAPRRHRATSRHHRLRCPNVCHDKHLGEPAISSSPLGPEGRHASRRRRHARGGLHETPPASAVRIESRSDARASRISVRADFGRLVDLVGVAADSRTGSRNMIRSRPSRIRVVWIELPERRASPSSRASSGACSMVLAMSLTRHPLTGCRSCRVDGWSSMGVR